MPRYTFSRCSLIEELFTVQAATEEEAHDMVKDGHPAVKIETGEWIDWSDDRYHLCHVEDELVQFVKGEAVNG